MSNLCISKYLLSNLKFKKMKIDWETATAVAIGVFVAGIVLVLLNALIGEWLDDSVQSMKGKPPVK